MTSTEAGQVKLRGRVLTWLVGGDEQALGLEFEAWARERTAVYARAMVWLIIAAAIAWWPIDAWLNRDDPDVLWTVSRWRIFILAVSTVTLVGLHLPAVRRHVFPFVAVSGVAHAALLAGTLSDIGGVDRPWFHSAYLVPTITLTFLVPLPQRILAVAAITAASLAASFARHPERLTAPHVGTAVATLVFAAAASAAVGHAIYVLLGENFRQRRALALRAGALEEQLAERLAEVRRLAAYLETSREEERKRIARELHDDLGQMLTAMRYDIDHARAATTSAEERVGALERLSGCVEELLQRVRRIVADMRPQLLDDLGLAAALEWLVETVRERGGPEVRLDVAPDLPGLDHRLAMAVYRIVQEALTNVLKHAEAQRAEVGLRVDDGLLRLEVRDDGVGMKSGGGADGNGLVGMRERARALGGRFSANASASGTTLRVELPLSPAEEMP